MRWQTRPALANVEGIPAPTLRDPAAFLLELAGTGGRGYRRGMATMPPVPSSRSRLPVSAPSAPKGEVRPAPVTDEERRERIAKAGRKFMDENAELLERLAK